MIMNRLKLNYIAHFILFGSAGLAILTRELWLIIPMLAAFIFVKTGKPLDGKEKEKIDDFANKVFAGSILLPIAAIFIVCIALVAYLILRNNIYNFA